MTLSSFEKWHRAFQHQRFEMRRLLMIEERLLALILFIQQKFIWVVMGSLDDELQVARLLAHFLSQLAQDRLDLLDLTVARPPSGYNHVRHGFT